MGRPTPEVRVSNSVLGGDDNQRKQGIFEGDASMWLVRAALSLRALERWILPDIRLHFVFTFALELDSKCPLRQSFSLSRWYGFSTLGARIYVHFAIEHQLRSTSISVHLRRLGVDVRHNFVLAMYWQCMVGQGSFLNAFDDYHVLNG